MLLIGSIILVVWIVVTALLENEHEVLASLLLIGTIYTGFHFGVSFLLFLYHNPFIILQMTLGYFVLGTFWAFAKWLFFVHEQLDRYREFKRNWIRSRGLSGTEIPDTLRFDFRSALGYTRPQLGKTPLVSEHKADIFVWMTYWPFSALWTLIDNPVRKIFRAIYHHISGTMQKISDRTFRDVRQELDHEISKP